MINAADMARRLLAFIVILTLTLTAFDHLPGLGGQVSAQSVEEATDVPTAPEANVVGPATAQLAVQNSGCKGNTHSAGGGCPIDAFTGTQSSFAAVRKRDQLRWSDTVERLKWSAPYRLHRPPIPVS